MPRPRRPRTPKRSTKTVLPCTARASTRGTRAGASATLVAHRRETIDHAERSRAIASVSQGKRIDQVAQSLMSELHHWKTPEQIHAEHPLVASVAAIKRDVWMRARNGLVELDAVRLVGSRCFVHAPRYLAWRFGERA